MEGDQTVTLHFPCAPVVFLLGLYSPLFTRLFIPFCCCRAMAFQSHLQTDWGKREHGVIKCSFAIYFLFYVLLYSFPKPFKCLWTLDEIKRVAIKARLLHLMFISTLRRSILN